MEQTKIDILRHRLVPKHVLLSKEEAENVCKQYHIEPHNLPRIRVSDPAARAIGAKVGDIIKIIRKSPTAGTAIAYRYVVEDE